MYYSDGKHVVTQELIRLMIQTLLAVGMPQKSAKVLTLGGIGRSTRALMSEGFPIEQITIVERNRTRAAMLRRQPEFGPAYIFHGPLSKAAQMMESAVGSRASVDVLDIDSDGTAVSLMGEVAPCMPLLARGLGKILVLTVADTRRNQALDDVPGTLATIRNCFQSSPNGIEWLESRIWPRLLAEHASYVPTHRFDHSADPAKAALRELHTVVEVVQMAHLSSLDLDPAFGGRFLYLGDAGFRMRSYFFRLRSGVSPEVSSSARAASIEEYLKHTCFTVNGEDTQALHAEGVDISRHPTFHQLLRGEIPMVSARQMSREASPRAQAPRPDQGPLNPEELDYVNTAVGFYDPSIKEAFERLWNAAVASTRVDEVLTQSHALLEESASMSPRFRQLCDRLWKVILSQEAERQSADELILTPWKPGFENAMATLAGHLKTRFARAVEQEANRLVAVAATHGLSNDQLVAFLTKSFDLENDSPPESSPEPAPPPAEPPPVAAPSPPPTSSKGVKRRTLTPVLLARVEKKDRGLDLLVLVNGRPLPEAYQITAERFPEIPEKKVANKLRAIRARWSGGHLLPSLIAYVGYAQSEDDLSLRLTKLLKLFSFTQLRESLARRREVRLWSEREVVEPKLEAWLTTAMLRWPVP